MLIINLNRLNRLSHCLSSLQKMSDKYAEMHKKRTRTFIERTRAFKMLLCIVPSPPQTTYIAICKSDERRKCQEANKDYAAIQQVFENISDSIPQVDLSFQLLYFVLLLTELLILFQRQSQVLRYTTGVEHIIAIGITSELPTSDFTPICNFLLQHCVFCVLFVSSLSQNIGNHNVADR